MADQRCQLGLIPRKQWLRLPPWSRRASRGTRFLPLSHLAPSPSPHTTGIRWTCDSGSNGKRGQRESVTKSACWLHLWLEKPRPISTGKIIIIYFLFTSSFYCNVVFDLTDAESSFFVIVCLLHWKNKGHAWYRKCRYLIINLSGNPYKKNFIRFGAFLGLFNVHVYFSN